MQALIDMVVSLQWNKRPQHPSAVFSLEQFCIDTVMAMWHFHGGCQVGKVVDHDYKVLGVDALRVIDVYLTLLDAHTYWMLYNCRRPYIENKYYTKETIT
ncbi:protein hothead [Quercus suber]|uniref:Protein hothead n=1 Tax=Quercus suber TaxID=58331 RepID=A0AAW0IN20_QUESU